MRDSKSHHSRYFAIALLLAIGCCVFGRLGEHLAPLIPLF